MQSQLLSIHLSPEALFETPHIDDFVKYNILILNGLGEFRVRVVSILSEDYDLQEI